MHLRIVSCCSLFFGCFRVPISVPISLAVLEEHTGMVLSKAMLKVLLLYCHFQTVF